MKSLIVNSFIRSDWMEDDVLVIDEDNRESIADMRETKKGECSRVNLQGISEEFGINSPNFPYFPQKWHNRYPRQVVYVRNKQKNRSKRLEFSGTLCR